MRVPALLIGVGAGVLSALMLIPATADALMRLDSARAARAAVGDLALRPPLPPLPQERLIRASTRAAAAGLLAAQLRRLATSSGVLVETAVPVGGGPMARVQLRVSGSEAAVLGLADRIERKTQIARFTRWRIEGIGGSVRLMGEVAAPWG